MSDRRNFLKTLASFPLFARFGAGRAGGEAFKFDEWGASPLLPYKFGEFKSAGSGGDALLGVNILDSAPTHVGLINIGSNTPQSIKDAECFMPLKRHNPDPSPGDLDGLDDYIAEDRPAVVWAFKGFKPTPYDDPNYAGDSTVLFGPPLEEGVPLDSAVEEDGFHYLPDWVSSVGRKPLSMKGVDNPDVPPTYSGSRRESRLAYLKDRFDIRDDDMVCMFNGLYSLVCDESDRFETLLETHHPVVYVHYQSYYVDVYGRLQGQHRKRCDFLPLTPSQEPA